MLKLNNQQWSVVGIIVAIFVINGCLAISPIAISALWAINIILIVIGSSLFYILSNEDMRE